MTRRARFYVWASPYYKRKRHNRQIFELMRRMREQSVPGSLSLPPTESLGTRLAVNVMCKYNRLRLYMVIIKLIIFCVTLHEPIVTNTPLYPSPSTYGITWTQPLFMHLHLPVLNTNFLIHCTTLSSIGVHV